MAFRMEKGTMKEYTRKAISADLDKFCMLQKPDAFIEVCEWFNGEGVDITIGEKVISLTHGELTAIEVLSRMLGYGLTEKEA
jgi:hypothetical protein